MTDAQIPEIVQRFVRRHISSVEAVEVLLLLRGDPGRTWTPMQVSKELYSQPEAAAHRLDDLTARGLLERRDDAFRYRPREAGLADAVEALADTYARRRVRLISLIFGPAEEPMHTLPLDPFRVGPADHRSRRR